jgi:general secretion pathway protein I
MTNLVRSTGLTLIEVLVALVIIAVAMTAAIKATSIDISGIGHLQEKTMAMWVGQQAINEARVGLLVVPVGDTVQHDTTLLNRTWYWVLSKTVTPNPRITELTVQVFANEEDRDSKTGYLIKLTGYDYRLPETKTPLKEGSE